MVPLMLRFCCSWASGAGVPELQYAGRCPGGRRLLQRRDRVAHQHQQEAGTARGRPGHPQVRTEEDRAAHRGGLADCRETRRGWGGGVPPLATVAPWSATGSERYDGVCVQVKESWLAKLGNWSEALELYQVRTLQTCRIELVCAVMMLTVGCWLSVAGASSRQPEGPGGHGGHHEVLGRAGAVGRGGSCPIGPHCTRSRYGWTA